MTNARRRAGSANAFGAVIERMTSDQVFRDKMQTLQTKAARRNAVVAAGLKPVTKADMEAYLADPSAGRVYIRIPRVSPDVIACVCFTGAY